METNGLTAQEFRLQMAVTSAETTPVETFLATVNSSTLEPVKSAVPAHQARVPVLVAGKVQREPVALTR